MHQPFLSSLDASRWFEAQALPQWHQYLQHQAVLRNLNTKKSQQPHTMDIGPDKIIPTQLWLGPYKQLNCFATSPSQKTLKISLLDVETGFNFYGTKVLWTTGRPSTSNSLLPLLRPTDSEFRVPTAPTQQLHVSGRSDRDKVPDEERLNEANLADTC